VKILCTGDLHVGRRPSRLPDPIDARPHSCGACWTRIVDRAIQERVDLVAVGGDLVDRANRFYEAAGVLELGLRRLAHAGITTAMVAGNHDFDVLPWLVEGLGPEHVRLLGRGGAWERFTLERGGVALHVDGWSFPEASVRTSPLASYARPSDGVPVLGVLHGDLDQPTSPYAPLALADLRHRAATLWLLGHVHAPRLRDEPGSAAVLYPGSPQAMDPGEAGPHGVWIAEIESNRNATYRMVPLSTVRYEGVEVDVDGVDRDPEIDQRVTGAVRARLEAAAAEGGPLRYLCCRVRVVGRTPLHRQVEARLRGVCGDLELTRGEVVAFVESVEVRTRPARDLDEIARGSDAPAELARLIRALEAGTPDADQERLVRESERLVGEVRSARPYLSLADATGETAGVAAGLREQATLLLDELLSQKETVR
jgi:DNA repair protein SbcD/Mre11